MATDTKGRPSRGRDRLRNNFIVALADDFQEHGKGAIEKVRSDDPASYLRIIASLMPKEMDVKHQVSPLEHLSDEQLAELVDATERFLGERAGADVAAVEGGEESPESISPLH